jgi:hypothetical protein
MAMHMGIFVCTMSSPDSSHNFSNIFWHLFKQDLLLFGHLDVVLYVVLYANPAIDESPIMR